MNIAFCSTGCDLQSPLDNRFGRASFFLVYNQDSGEVTCIENTARSAAGGAGTMAVQQLVDNKAELVIAPEVGPQAMDALKKFNMKVFNQKGAKTAEEALVLYKENKLSIIEEPGAKGLHKV